MMDASAGTAAVIAQATKAYSVIVSVARSIFSESLS